METERTLRGALHLHTTYSHDGTMRTKELADFLRTNGYDFIAITEHSYDVNPDSMACLVSESQELSSHEFLVIPGIEFRCHSGLDIIDYGVTKTIDSEDPADVINHIKSNGGVAVWAHPSIQNYPSDKSWVLMLDGCEIYNNSKDGKFLPQRRSIKKYEILKKWHPGLLAFTGLDLYRKVSFQFLSLSLPETENNSVDILASLREGRFATVSKFFRVNSKGELSSLSLASIYTARVGLNLIKFLRNIIKG